MIEFVHEEFPQATMQARRDFAHVTGQRIIANPYWFRDDSTGQEYYGLYACIGWPQKVSEKDDQLPGYAAVVAVFKDDSTPPEDAKFQVVAEAEDLAPVDLIQKCVQMRKKWGFGVHRHLLRVFIGDFRQFENVVANHNARIIEAGAGNDRDAFIISPPDDFDNPRAFDLYMGTLRAVLGQHSKRLYIGNHEIIQTRLLAFCRDDPAIMALGGLVHTMLIRTPWMEQSTPSVFQLPDI